jgi:hypothetical protein
MIPQYFGSKLICVDEVDGGGGRWWSRQQRQMTNGMGPTCWCCFQHTRGMREYFSEIAPLRFCIFQKWPHF